MLTVTKLQRKPKKFHTFTGLTPEQFETLLKELEPVYQEHLRCPDSTRSRAPGAGRPFTLAVAERLLMTLMYWRLYLTQNLLGYLFDLDDSNVSREIRRIRSVLLQVLPVPMRDSNLVTPATPTASSRISTLAQLLAQHPEFNEVLIDATEQPVFRPQDPLARRQRFSGKRKYHTVKTQVVTTPHVILHLFGDIPGCVNDNFLLKGTGVITRIPADRRIRLDLGYESIEQTYPDKQIEKPVRAQRNHALTTLGKVYNRMLSRLRLPVEHVIGRLKQFNILHQVYRGRWADHEEIATIIAGLVNFKALKSFAW